MHPVSNNVFVKLVPTEEKQDGLLVKPTVPKSINAYEVTDVSTDIIGRQYGVGDHVLIRTVDLEPIDDEQFVVNDDNIIAVKEMSNE